MFESVSPTLLQYGNMESDGRLVGVGRMMAGFMVVLL